MRDTGIKGVLIDLDGVVYQDNKLIDGAAENIQFLREKGVPFRFLTNTTIKSRKQIVDKINSLGIRVNENEVFSALYAVEKFLSEKKAVNVFPLLKSGALKDFPFHFDEALAVDYVVVGDMEDEFDYDNLNKAFRFLMDGAVLVAAQKNRYWKKNNALYLDVGGFIALLEYASGVAAVLIGKPAKHFFHLACADMLLTPDDVLMIGDDIVTDVKGAMEAGLKSSLVKTGKFRNDDLLKHDIEPDYLFGSIKELKTII